MRTLPVGVLLLALAVARGRTAGLTEFSNYKPGLVDAPVFDVDGVTRLGADFFGQLYTGSTPTNLAATGSPIRFRTLPGGNSGSGYVFDAMPVPGQDYLQLRVWPAGAGPSYEAALSSRAKVGKSGIFRADGEKWSVIPVPAVLTNLQSFALFVPGPAVTNPIQDLVVDENAPDAVLALASVFKDPQTPPEDLEYSIASNDNPGLISVGLDNAADLLTLHFAPGQYGAANITVRATDADGLSADDRFLVTVRANAPPVSTGFGATTTKNALLRIPVSSLLEQVRDPEGAPVSLVTVTSPSIQGALVTLNSGTVYYFPPDGFVGADRFTYMVSDPLGATTTVDAQIAVLAPGVTTDTLQLPMVTPTAVSFAFTGIPGKTYQVLRASAATGPWESIGTINILPDGSAGFTDNAPLPAAAFYRTVLLPYPQ